MNAHEAIDALEHLGFFPGEAVKLQARREPDPFIPETGHAVELDDEDLRERGPARYLTERAPFFASHGVDVTGVSDAVTANRAYLMYRGKATYVLSPHVDEDRNVERSVVRGLLHCLNEWARAANSRWRFFVRHIGNDSNLVALRREEFDVARSYLVTHGYEAFEWP